MNFDELRRRTRRHLQEFGTAGISDQMVDDELNRAQRTLSREFGLFRAPFTQTLTTYHFTPPTDFGGFAGAVLTNGFTLPVVDPANIRIWDKDAFTATAQQGTPQFVWYGRGYSLGVDGDIYVWPTPPLTGVRLDFVYHRKPTTMTDSTHVPWFGAYDDHQDLIALRAADQLNAQLGGSAAKDSGWVQRLQLRMESFRASRGADVDNPPLSLRFGPPVRQNSRRMGGC